MENKYLVPAVLRAFSVLEYIAEQDKVGFSEIMAAVGIPRSSLSHILNTLIHLGYIRQQKGNYVVAGKAHELSHMVLSKMDLRAAALPVMREVAGKVDLSCNLGVIRANEAIYAAKVDNKNAYMSMAWAGKRIALMTSALGKSLLSMLPDDEVDALLEANPTYQTSAKAVPKRDEFFKELEQVRILGWAMDQNAVTDGISCVGVPIKNCGELCAAISVSGDSEFLKNAHLEFIVHELMTAAARISDTLPYRA
jgi:DNA-binding IclR family transcriptional regulator